MGIVVLVIFLIILVYVIRKLSFKGRLQVGIFSILLVGLHHAYIAITSVEKEDVNEAIIDYTKKCSDLSNVELVKNTAINIFSHAAANGVKKPVAEAKAKIYSEYLIKTGGGGVSDVLNVFPSYIAENYLGFDSEKEIEQIGMKAGIEALEEAECNINLTYRNRTSEKPLAKDNEKKEIIKSNNKAAENLYKNRKVKIYPSDNGIYIETELVVGFRVIMLNIFQKEAMLFTEQEKFFMS